MLDNIKIFNIYSSQEEQQYNNILGEIYYLPLLNKFYLNNFIEQEDDESDTLNKILLNDLNNLKNYITEKKGNND